VGLVAVCGLMGCTAPLDITKKFTLDVGGDYSKQFDLPEQPKEQTIKAEMTSTESDVDVFIIPADKQAAFDKATNSEARAAAAAASQLKTKSATVSATIPPKTEVRVLVQIVGMKKTEVTLKMTNRK
jgi:HSP20 family molecular chaperone IbpA